jgi:CRISPR/Cas system CSM-associated protein Csm3 (group 7 of RAMP superfamily)
MARKPVNIALALVFQTPPSIAAAGAFGSIADRVVERNGRGQFIIPGSQVKGKVRHACEQLARSIGQSICDAPRAATMCPNPPGSDPACPLCRIFGSPALRSPVCFADLVWEESSTSADEEPTAPARRAMIGINRRRATVADDRLFLVETAPYFQAQRFRNAHAITGTLESAAQIKLLLAGLHLILAWGGMKSRGLGWIAQVEATATWDGSPVQATDWQEVQQLWSDIR